MRVQSTLTTLFPFGNKVCFENKKRMRGEIKYLRSLEYTRLRLVFPTSLVLSSLPACIVTEQSTVEAFLFVNYHLQQ